MTLLKIKEVAERLNCSVQNVHNLKDAGLLPVVHTGASGKGYRVREDDLLAFMQSGTRGRSEKAQEWPATKPPKPTKVNMELW